MVPFTVLQQQNDRITELSNVLGYLVGNRSICDTEVTCELFSMYVDKVQEHLELEERELYQTLLTHGGQQVQGMAQKFLSGSAEIKRVFSQYLKRWCKDKAVRAKHHTQFVTETREMFQLVMKRIQDEVEQLYPTVREVEGSQFAA